VNIKLPDLKSELNKAGHALSGIATHVEQDVKKAGIDIALAEMSTVGMIKGTIRSTLKGISMNTELKVLLGVGFGIAKMAKDWVEKKGTAALLGDLEQIGVGAWSLVPKKDDLKNEVTQLKDPAAQADLIAEAKNQFNTLYSDPLAQDAFGKSLEAAAAVSAWKLSSSSSPAAAPAVAPAAPAAQSAPAPGAPV
jgi:hypothetical protein